MRDRKEVFHQLCSEAEDLFAEKNRQYGDAIRFGGVLGACYHIIGAAMRLPRLVFSKADHGRSAAGVLKDILMDIHNYANIALMMIDDDNWEGTF